MPPRAAGGRRPPDIYAIRRRRAVALAVVGVLVVLGFVLLVGGGGAEKLSKAEALRAERAENPVEMTLSFSGDLLIHSPLWNQALANGGGSSYGGGGGYNSGPRQMYPAVCSNCGKATEVPFQPRTDKPVYCRECFQERRASTPRYSNY